MKTYHNILKNAVVFEGLDGAGTTTQARLLFDSLKLSGIATFLTCEPTDSPIGKLIRLALKGDIEITPRSLAFLFAADRDDHVFSDKNGMLKLSNNNTVVISDRYFFSSLAYQTIQNDYADIETINSYFPNPEIIIYIDTPPEICIKRLENRDSHDNYETLAFQTKVYSAYEKAFSNLPDSVHLIRLDGTLPISDLSERIFSCVHQIISIASP